MPYRGLSPRARGNLFGHLLRLRRRGTIPASTGEPDIQNGFLLRSGDYPREHGGTSVARWRNWHRTGLSPRARGNHEKVCTPLETTGTIPASTGEPREPISSPPGVRDYPREHGGTGLVQRMRLCHSGLSPRARGNRAVSRALLMSMGTIPASTGEPILLALSANGTRDYPREHGGTRSSADVVHRA